MLVERMKLLLAILRVVENKDPKGEITYFSVAQLRKSIETDTKIPHDKRVILGEVLKAREYEERYERNECGSLIFQHLIAEPPY